jgi:hypothetical protein
VIPMPSLVCLCGDNWVDHNPAGQDSHACDKPGCGCLAFRTDSRVTR